MWWANNENNIFSKYNRMKGGGEENKLKRGKQKNKRKIKMNIFQKGRVADKERKMEGREELDKG